MWHLGTWFNGGVGSAELGLELDGLKGHFQPKQLYNCRVFQAPGTHADDKAVHYPSSQQESVAALLKNRRDFLQQPFLDKL